MNQDLSYVRFNNKVIVLQQIVDADSGELLFELKSSVLLLNVKYFGIILFQYLKRLREGRKHLKLIVSASCPVQGTNELQFFD